MFQNGNSRKKKRKEFRPFSCHTLPLCMHSMASDSPSRKWKQSNPHRHAMAFVKGKFPTHTSWFIQVILWEQKRNPSRLLHRLDRTNRYILASVRWWISGPTVRYATGHPFPVDPVEAIRCTYVTCFCFFLCRRESEMFIRSPSVSEATLLLLIRLYNDEAVELPRC